MDKQTYKAALAVAMKDHAELSKLRAEIDKRLAGLTETIASLSRLLRHSSDIDLSDFGVELSALPEPGLYELGLSDLCRQVLKVNGEWMTPMEVRDALADMGIDIKKLYSNPLAVIHTTLKRLHDSGEIDLEYDKTKGKTYKWLAPKLPARAIPARTKVQGHIDDDEIPF